MERVAKDPGSAMLTRQLTRRSFLGWSAATAVGLASTRLLLTHTGPDRVTLSWLSPRRTLAVVDDYPIWVARELGYMDQLGIDLNVVGDVSAPPPLAAKPVLGMSITFPSAALLVSSADRGLGTQSIFQLCAGSMFGFALSKQSRVQRPKDLGGASIAVGDESWKEIVDPLLVEAGVDPRRSQLVIAGDEWLKVVAAGDADAALSWRGLERSTDGRSLRHFLGDHWSQLPANAYAVESPDLLGDRDTDGLTRFLKAVVSGLEFASENPVAAAQITYRSAPGLHEVMAPRATVDALAVTSSVYSAGRRRGLPWGLNEEERWRRYAEAAGQAGMVKSIDPKALYTNRLIEAANSVDIATVRLNAATYALDGDFRHINSPTGG